MLELYIKDGCPHCRKQIEQLERDGVPYRLHNVSRDRSALNTVKEEFGAGMVPLLVENGRVKSVGFEGMG